MHGFEGGADGFFAAEVGYANDLPVDIVDEVVKDGFDVGVGEGNVQVAKGEFFGALSQSAWMVSLVTWCCRFARSFRFQVDVLNQRSSHAFVETGFWVEPR